MTDVTQLQQYLKLADQLVAISDKQDLAECARLLALNVAHYEMKFGALSLDETLAVAYSDEPNDSQIELVSKGLETMVGILGGILQGFEKQPSH